MRRVLRGLSTSASRPLRKLRLARWRLSEPWAAPMSSSRSSCPEHYRYMFMRRPDPEVNVPSAAELETIGGLARLIELVRKGQATGAIEPRRDAVEISLRAVVCDARRRSIARCEADSPWATITRPIRR